MVPAPLKGQHAEIHPPENSTGALAPSPERLFSHADVDSR